MFNQLEAAELAKLLDALNLNLDLNSAKKISRGQLQRLGLIRALLKNSSLMILDEPTAGLDFETEEKVLSVLKSYSSRRTIIIATHRAAVINFSENVIEL
jgi:ABC-type transport system involved in cytochrome bd biosynthesis fused ATPase/permease subunit